ncbi:hypothetical protein ABT158_48610 [Nonomuraea sp. NPDC001636]|uniref:hypothetical protein n=1 Tax=Nonomuraea sp. NPDC001636 TaxID=3154391 RepID=UPI0033206E7C
MKQLAWYYTAGEWIEGEDLVAAQARPDEEEGKLLSRLGYEPRQQIGSWESVSPAIGVWFRREKVPRHVLTLSGGDGYERVFVDRLPDVWDLLARWAPVVRDAATVRLLEDLTDVQRRPYGIVEMIARRAAGAVQPWSSS